MIIDRRTGLIQLLREGLPALGVLFAWDVLVVVVFQIAHRPWMDQPSLPTSLIGSALVLFLSVRNDAAYARWWRDAKFLDFAEAPMRTLLMSERTYRGTRGWPGPRVADRSSGWGAGHHRASCSLTEATCI